MRTDILNIAVLFLLNTGCSAKNELGKEIPHPEILRISAVEGRTGDRLEIHGNSFGSEPSLATVYFGNRNATIVSFDDNKIDVVAPPNDMGKVNLFVKKGEKRSNNLSFTYLEGGDTNPNISEWGYDNKGHQFYPKARDLSHLRHNGPFVLLKDGRLFRARYGGSDCHFSSDNGATWSTDPMLDPDRFVMESPVCLLTSKGTLIVGFSNLKELSPLNWNYQTHSYASSANRPAYAVYSTDNGQTWSEPTKLHDGWTGMNRDIIETENGTVIFSTMNMRNNPGRNCVLTYSSFDDGRTWVASNMLDNPNSAGDHAGLMEAALTQLGDGRIWLVIRTNWDYLYESYSTDEGRTWSPYAKTDFDASSSPPAVSKLASGRIVLIWSRLYRQGETTTRRHGGDNNLSSTPASWQRDELSMVYSDDDGNTWSEPFILAKNIIPMTDPLGQVQKRLSYPMIFEREPGKIWITAGQGNLTIELDEKNFPQ